MRTLAWTPLPFADGLVSERVSAGAMAVLRSTKVQETSRRKDGMVCWEDLGRGPTVHLYSLTSRTLMSRQSKVGLDRRSLADKAQGACTCWRKGNLAS